MRKHLWRKLSVILIIMYFIPPAWGGGNERELESYVPLRMHFIRAAHPATARVEGTLSSDGKIHVVVYRDFGDIREESLIEPTDEEWEEFFNVVELTNIWGLGEEEGLLPSDMFVIAPYAIFWRLGLEYPDRILNIGGLEVAVDTKGVDLMGGGEILGDRWRITISYNLLIANEFENIHRIFFAIQKLLGEDFSAFDFNLIKFEHRLPANIDE